MNAIIHASRLDMVGGDLFLVGFSVDDQIRTARFSNPLFPAVDFDSLQLRGLEDGGATMPG